MRIREGIDERDRALAAEIYWLAFKGKLAQILGPDEKGRAYFEAALNLHQAFGAFEGEELVGIAGFDVGQGGVFDERASQLFRIYGMSALWRIMLLSVFSRAKAPGALHIDGIAVAENARNQGIGSALLDALTQKAKAAHCSHIRLDVIDTNPRAKALYERAGFEVVKESRLGPFARIYHFHSAYQMRKAI